MRTIWKFPASIHCRGASDPNASLKRNSNLSAPGRDSDVVGYRRSETAERIPVAPDGLTYIATIQMSGGGSLIWHMFVADEQSSSTSDPGVASTLHPEPNRRECWFCKPSRNCQKQLF